MTASTAAATVSTLDKLSRTAIDIRRREQTKFEAIFPRIVAELTKPTTADADCIDHSFFREGPNGEIRHVHKWLAKMLQYTVTNGKLIRGLSMTINYQILRNGYEAMKSTTNGYTASGAPDGDGALIEGRILGWCVEMFQAYFLVLDDIMDNSLTRRGQPCWYRKENVGLIALNDSTLIEASLFHLMHRYFRNHPSYAQLVHLMHEGFRITGYGQSLDMLTESESVETATTRNLSVYCIERYRTIVQYKTSFYSCVLPTRLALYLANRTDADEHRQVESIMLKIGELFQVQDDYLDCYGEPSVIGKIGIDIRQGKCSWLVVKALELANEEQRKILKHNYGQDDAVKEATVKQLYKELNLEVVYRSHERDALQEILQEIEKLKQSSDGTFPVEVFYEPLSHVYLREK